MDSIRIRGRRTWFRYSENRGGDAVEFLRHFHGMSFGEAVGFLLAFNGYPVDSPNPPPLRKSRPPPQRERPAFVLPPPNGNNERVRAYLRGRGIASSIIDSFIEAGLLYEDERHNCVFVGRNSAGKPVFAARRGTYDRIPFRGGVPGSDKEAAFRLPCYPALDWVAVFEAPIDLMSFFTLYPDVKSNAIALCCLYDGPLGTYLAENPHIRRIELCLDNDGPGRQAVGRFGEKYRVLGYGVADRPPPAGKDWNNYLQQRVKER